MAQVMYDKAIKFESHIYTVTQTWMGPKIVVSVNPESDRLQNLITDIIQKQGQITLRCCAGYYEIVVPEG